ncbi:MAG TPA: histidine phosphatase family protein, partial [Gaiella sp.]
MTDVVRLVFETHSLTVDNERGIATGWLGGALSARGRAFAEELGERRRDDGIDACFASDLARAVETAEIAFAATDIPVLLDWRLRELDYGELNGAPADAIAAERGHRVDVPFPGGESYRDAVGRLASFLDDVRVGYAGERILLIGHTATRWALDHLIDGRPLEQVVTAPFDWSEGWEYDLDPSPRAI